MAVFFSLAPLVHPSLPTLPTQQPDPDLVIPTDTQPELSEPQSAAPADVQPEPSSTVQGGTQLDHQSAAPAEPQPDPETELQGSCLDWSYPSVPKLIESLLLGFLFGGFLFPSRLNTTSLVPHALATLLSVTSLAQPPCSTSVQAPGRLPEVSCSVFTLPQGQSPEFPGFHSPFPEK